MYRAPLLLGLLVPLSACVDNAVSTFNASPVVVILSHLDGDEVRADEAVAFRAGVSDPDNRPEELTARWFVDDQEACEGEAADDEGITTCDIVLDESDQEVRVEVHDPANAAASARVVLDIQATQGPQAYIVSPEASVLYYTDQLITFQGLLLDWEDDSEVLTAWWELEGVGDMGLDATPDDQGVILDFTTLPEGEHPILLHVTDSAGKTGLDSVVVTVGAPNSAPSCAITRPSDGDSGASGEDALFEAQVGDPDVSPDLLLASWRSDQDGFLGQSKPDTDGLVSFTTNALSVGTHTVTLEVEDDVGATCADFVHYSIGSPPTVGLSAPLLGDVYRETDVVLFAASVGDGEDRPEDLELRWESSLDGVLSTASADSVGLSAFSRSDLRSGVHDLILTVTDTDGLYAQAATSFAVNGLPSAPVVVLSPDPAVTSDDLVATITTDSVDPDGDPVTLTWAWSVDGAPSTASTSSALAASATARGDTWKITVTPSDGVHDGAVGEAELVIDNTAPEVASATLTPDPASESDTLTCTPGATSDVDGDAVVAEVSWSVAGVTLTGLGSTLDGTWFSRDDEVFCTVTPDDGVDAGTLVDSNLVTISNGAPAVTSVAITPDPPEAGDVLTCAASGFSDPDGDADASSYAWSLNGTPDGTGTTYAGAFVRGDVVTCDVTPSDGLDTGTVVSASVTVDNSAPAITSVTITPDPASPSDTLTCAWSGFSDADGDSDQSTLAWSIAGTTVGTSATLGGVIAKDDVVTCTVTPDDGLQTGSPVAAVVTIGNTAPVATGVSISPTTPVTDDVLAASASATDADGDAVTFSYDWYVDGGYAASGSTLDGALHFDRGQAITLEATPNDGSEDGATLASSSVTVANSAPSIASVSLSPTAPQAGDTLTCSYGGFADADGDADASTFAWALGGTSVGSGAVYPGTPANGDAITCTVTPDDGTDTGTALSVTATVGNSAPSITSVVISPDPATVSDTLTCSYTGFSDPDGDPDASTIAWTVGGTTVGTASTLSTGFGRDDVITCSVTPSDGTNTGTTLSDTLTVSNTAPSVSAVSLSPSSPATGDTLVASASTSDADGDSLSLGYDWYVDGGYVASGSSTLSGASYFDRDQTVSVVVTPSDGTDSGSSLTSSTVTVVNTAPSISSVAISPASPAPGDTLTCAWSGYSDADGDADASTLAWEVNSTSAGSGSSPTGSLADGDVVTCTVTPHDGIDSGSPVSATAVVGNSPPSISTVSISPDPADASDTLTCSYSGYSDPEGDADASTVAWSISGSTIGAGSTLSSGFAKADTVTCSVTPYDGSSTGTVVTDNLVIDNQVPVVSAVSITPSAATTDDTLTASASTGDGDGDSVSVSYDWSVDGTYVSTGTTLSGATSFDKGQVVEVTATPDDGDDTGSALTSAAITIQNSPPSLSSVAVSPASPAPGDTLVCTASGYSDADGDLDVSTYAWSIAGSTVGTGTTYSGALADGDVVTCTVTPDDGSDTGTDVSTSVTVGSSNAAPVVTAVSIAPSSPVTDDVLTASASTSDADGDTVTVTFDWSVDGTYAATGTTLDGASYFDKGQVVEVTATPHDGTEYGSAATSSSVTVVNSAPSLTSASITPASPTDADTLTCSGNGFSDADGDTDVSTYAWSIAGSTVGTGTTYSGALADGDVVTCTVTPDDGSDTGTDVSTSVTVGSSNAAPVVTAVSIAPSSPVTDDVLTASASTSDADGDTVTVTFDWSVDGTYAATGTTLDGASYFDKGQVVEVTATPHDGTEYGSAATSSSVTVVNSAPSLTSASITPASPTDADTLTCSGNGFSDADGDTDVSTYAWSIAGSTVGTGTTYAGTLSDGDVVTCTVTPDDGSDAGTDVSTSVTVSSGASPSIASVSITPDPADASDTLTCSYTGFTDPQGDPDASTFAWTVNGSSAGTSNTLSGSFAKADTVACIVTPSDGSDTGTALNDSLVIENQVPVLAAVMITPTLAYTDDVLTAVVTTSDGDGDAVAVSYEWYVDGTFVASGSDTLDGALYFDRDEAITVIATPDDGDDIGSSLTSSSLTILNSAPELSSAVITPSSPTPSDTLSCSGSGWYDADGDSDASTTAWSIGGSTVGTGSSYSGSLSDGDVVTCAITADDGTDPGATVTATVTVGETSGSPSITSVTISPSPAYDGDTLTCSYSGFSDPQGDADASTYEWTVNGSSAGSASTFAGSFGKGDSVVCTVTPSDGTDLGTPLSDSLIVSNTAPEVASVSISPSSPDTDDVLTASASTSDADGDSVSVSYDWYVDGSFVASGTTTLDGATYFDAGQTVYVEATPDDGDDLGTPVSSAVVTVGNSAPSISSVTVSPDPAIPSDTLLCSYSGYSDPDGDADASTYAWDVNGTGAGSASTLSGAFVGGDVVTCTVTPSDGSDSGSPLSDAVVIGNTPPEVTAVSISPASPDTADVLVASASTTDADGDTVTLTYDWSVDGGYVTTGSTLDGATFFDRDQVVEVTATPHDGTEFGTSMTSSSVTIVNSAPSTPAISISPSSPTEGTDDLICAIDTASTDADGDSITTTFTWTVDGLDYPAGDTADTATWLGPDTTIYTDDTVPAEDILDGETWVCTVTASDGTDTSAGVSTFVTVGSSSTSYSGTWTLDSTVSHTCAFGLVNINFSQVLITDSYPTIVVAEASSQPGTMAGSFTSATDWSATNSITGSCTEDYTMTGTFTDANTFTGTFEADFTGGCLGCSYQSWSVTGTK